MNATFLSVVTFIAVYVVLALTLYECYRIWKQTNPPVKKHWAALTPDGRITIQVSEGGCLREYQSDGKVGDGWRWVGLSDGLRAPLGLSAKLDAWGREMPPSSASVASAWVAGDDMGLAALARLKSGLIKLKAQGESSFWLDAAWRLAHVRAAHLVATGGSVALADIAAPMMDHRSFMEWLQGNPAGVDAKAIGDALGQSETYDMVSGLLRRMAQEG